MEAVEERVNPGDGLAAVAHRARRLYAACVAGAGPAPPWWTAVVITANSRRQAEGYESELRRRQTQGRIPSGAAYLVVPDFEDRRIGSGGATLHALGVLAAESGAPSGSLEDWWAGQRVLMIHCGGDSRRLPQYSLSGKLFSALPVKTPWGEPSTVFDEMLALSTAWVERLPSGLVVGSGDVILTFDAAGIDWSRKGVSGVAILQPAQAGTHHGVYVTDERGRVYSFLQKPSVAALTAAGGLLPAGLVALDSGLLRFSPEVAARLMRLGSPLPDGRGSVIHSPPAIDLYQHMTMALTGQWRPELRDAPSMHAVFEALDGMPFWCSVVAGDFTHIGTTSLFRRLMTEDTDFSRLYAAQQRLGANRQQDVRSSGVVIDSVLSGGAELGPATVAIECDLAGRVRAASGSVLHGLEGIPETVEVPEDTVVHQLPVRLADGRRGVVIRVYGVEDDPKAAGGGGTWFGRPILDELSALGLDPSEVWPGLPLSECALWNACLFPVGTAEEAWASVRWMLRLANDYSPRAWRETERLSLATSAQWADGAALEAARTRRLRAYWRTSALSLVESGADIRPLLANAPGTGPLAETGQALCARAGELETDAPTEAASRYYTAGLFLGQAGLAGEAEDAQAAAFRLVQCAVDAGAAHPPERCSQSSWSRQEVTVQAPARIDLGGGWSDTPPFCLDWGGTVLNMAVLIDGAYPIHAAVRRLREPVVRCISGETGSVVEYGSCAELLAPAAPGDELSIPRGALRMSGLFRAEEPLEEILGRMGGGIEIRTAVNLPMGSGLGTSSILAAALLRALWEMRGVSLDDQRLSEQVMRLEQIMTTGGGWQDQAGGIFPGAKLLVSGPGLRQRIRVQPVPWTPQRAAEFEGRLVFYYTGIRRIARDLLRQVVGRYLARETSAVQVLHSIKTLAMEMSYALQEGEWERLGALLDRHRELNQVLDPNTTNAPIHRLLERVRPYIHGAKLAGAGGGGFLIMLARSPEAASDLRRLLQQQPGAGAGVHTCSIAEEGLRCVSG